MVCQQEREKCGGPTPVKDPSKKQYLMIGDSISIGIQKDGGLFDFLPGYESQHIPCNGGPASKGFQCIRQWLGSNTNRTWDLITFNFGLHSLDCCPVTTESETLANYTLEIKSIATTLKAASKTVIWVDTTPVPLNVTQGPPRHNSAVIEYNKAAAAVMDELDITTCDVYSAVMEICPPTSGPPDNTYTSCKLQSPGGVHFPSHYQPLVNQMLKCITGKTLPPTPAPLPPAEECKHAEDAACKNATVPFCKGGGGACQQNYGSHRDQLKTAYCLDNYTKSGILHPQEAYVQCWCLNTSWGGWNCSS
jgi:hypothetical protein